MKYATSHEIALPRDEVLTDRRPRAVAEWLHGLVLHETVKGMRAQVGTTSRVVFQMGK